MAVTNAPGGRGRAADGCGRAAAHDVWTSILDEKFALDLAPLQVKQAETQRAAADTTVTARLPETYQWLLVPVPSNSAARASRGSRGQHCRCTGGARAVW